MEKLNYDEFKELCKLFYMAGLNNGKKAVPIMQIPMGSRIKRGTGFEDYFEQFVKRVGTNLPPGHKAGSVKSDATPHPGQNNAEGLT